MNTDSTGYVDYGDSAIRAAITWLAYPVCVLVPFTWLVFNVDFDKPGMLAPFAFMSLFTAGIMEWVHPHALPWRKSHGDILTDIIHNTASIGMSMALRAGLVYAFFTLLTLPVESYALVTWPTQWPFWAQVILGLIAAEFGAYWRHRLFHEWLPGWRFHSIHHSSRRLYFFNATRFHFIDLCLSGIAAAIPLALCGATPEVVALVGIFTAMHGNWQHTNVRHKLGWLNWVFASAELHRWHHCSDIRHTNSNYGNNLIIFDTLFGTRCLPKQNQDVEKIGMGELDEVFPQSWWQHLLVPFRWNAMLKNGEITPPTATRSNVVKEYQ